MEVVSWEGFSLDGFYTKKGLGLHLFEDLPVKGFSLYGHSGNTFGILSEIRKGPIPHLLYQRPSDK